MATGARRIIMHVDMDAFYASVELRRRPELRGTPVIVGGSPRGVVLSASYEARACGVRSGMPSAQAHLAGSAGDLRRPDFDSYSAVSKAIVAVFSSVTSVVESASIDEAFLDLTGSERMLGSPARIGEYVRAVVSDEQQITCSVGIGPTKFVAKVASRAAKPDGLVEVTPQGIEAFLHPLPVEAMWAWVSRRPTSCTGWGCSRSATSPTPCCHAAPHLRPACRPGAGRAGLGAGPAPGGAAGARAQRGIAADVRRGQ